MELLETEHVCSVASKRGSYQTTVKLEGMTSRDLSFIIIPMVLGSHTIEVKAAVFDTFYSDGIKKELRVVVSPIIGLA